MIPLLALMPSPDTSVMVKVAPWEGGREGVGKRREGGMGVREWKEGGGGWGIRITKTKNKTRKI